ncbi:MAG: tetratricopeptide repeat protein [Bryobacteraceae bacterium]
MAGPLSKAPPPPPTAAQRAHRRRQKRLVFGTLGGFLLLLVAWETYDYVASAPERAELQVQAGAKLLIPGHYEEALGILTKAMELDPNSWNAYLNRGLAKQNLGQLDAALTDFQHALLLKPDLLQARTARASIYLAKGDSQHAVEELTKVIDLQPSVDAYTNRATAYAQIGQHELAIQDFTWLIEQLRDAPFAYYGRARSKRALGDQAGSSEDERIGKSFDRGNLN